MPEKTETGTTDHHWLEAQTAWEAGLLDKARLKLEERLRSHPQDTPALALLGQVAQAQRLWKEARRHFEQARELAPENPEYTHLLAQWFVARQGLPEAEALYAAFLTAHPGHPSLQVEYAALLGARGALNEAETQLKTCLADYPDQLDAWLLYGNLAAAMGQFKTAENAYQEIISRQPKLPEVYRRKGQLALLQGQPEQAITQFEQALELDRDDAESWSNLGAVKLMIAQTPAERGEAIRACMQGLLRDNRNPQILANIGLGFFQLELYPETLFYLDQARSLDPQLQMGDFEVGMSLLKIGKAGHALAYLQNCLSAATEPPENLAQVAAWLGYIRAQQGDLVQAQKDYLALAAIDPHQGGNWLADSLLPPIATSEAAWQDYAGHYRRALAKLLQAPASRLKQMPVDMPGLFWAYQSENVRPEQEIQAQLWQRALQDRLCNTAHTTRPNAPWRIGLVSRYFHNHSVMGVFARLIQALSQEPSFEVELFMLGPSGEDATTAFLSRLSLKRHFLGGQDLDQINSAILSRELDVLLYPELGMDPLTFALACSRLAPYQSVLSGHPITTGLNTIDSYISSSWLEPPENAQEAYCEKLICLPELLPDFPFPTVPQQPKSRAELGLKQKHVYLCPMMLFKLHPAMDAVFAEILARDREAEIVFFQYPPYSLHDGLEKTLLKRWARSIPQAKRLRFLPWASREDLLRLIQHADVVLDSFPFGGGNTSYLTLAMGTPLVTLAAPYLRGRSSTGMYLRMGLPELPAQSPADYVEKALKWANDPQARSEVKALIEAKRGVLFDNPAGSQALIGFLQNSLGNIQNSLD